MWKCARITLNSYYEHYAVPKLDKDALPAGGRDRVGAIRTAARGVQHLLPGPYVEGFIDPAVTGDTLQISLGRDKSVPIKRETVTDLYQNHHLRRQEDHHQGLPHRNRNNKSVPVTLTVKTKCRSPATTASKSA